jgi:hypothetical protein
MSLPASFLGGAKDRLLPASIPFRFFAAASVFHLSAWLVLLLGAEQLPSFTGEPGLVLAAVHLLTLGVLVMTVMGASYQLLPVATLKPLKNHWPARTSFWFMVPGTLLLTSGMVNLNPLLLYSGALAVTIALVLFGWLMANNLWQARKAMPVVSAHGWAGLVSLIGFLVIGLTLVADFADGFLPDRRGLATTHMLLAVFGFMGLLTFGFSHVLIPMFVLSRALPVKKSWVQFALAGIAVAVAVGVAFWGNWLYSAFSAILGLSASLAFFVVMGHAFKTAMRKRLGLSFVLIKASWGLLVGGLAIGLVMSLGVKITNGETLFGFVLLVGWLLTFLAGILQRIMPFLASMHAAGKAGMPPLLSDLTAETPLKLHAGFHLFALILCGIAIVANNPVLATVGAVAGLAGALAFAVFAALVIAKLGRA